MTDKSTEIGIPIFQFVFERQHDEWTTIVVIPVHMTTYAEKPMKIGLEVAEIFGRICRFLPSRPKSAVATLAVSRVTGPNVTKIVYNIEKFILFNILKSELQYCNPLRNGSATKEIGTQKNADFSTLIGCYGNVLWEIWKSSMMWISTYTRLPILKFW